MGEEVVQAATLRCETHPDTERIVPFQIDDAVASVTPDDIPGPAKEYA